MSDPYMVKSVGLRREFGDTVAVADVTLAVPKGAVLALVGPNGAGKTTWLKMVAALLEPTRGTALVGGLDVRKHPRDVHALLGFLPDFFGMYEDLRVGDYLDYFARAYRLDDSRRAVRIPEVLEQVGLQKRLESAIGTLSRGMRQRLGIARTLIHDPPLLLLDEPASGLDPEARHGLQSLFRRLAQSGKTLIVSSHILTELEEYCTHVAILKEGRLVKSGLVQDVRRSLARGRRIRVRAAEGLERVQGIFSGDDRVKGWDRDADGGFFDYSGDDNGLAELLKKLISGGVRVSFFGEDRGNIQDAYLSLMGEAEK